MDKHPLFREPEATSREELVGSACRRVFISYAHETEAHRDRVRELAERLRHDGIDCVVDQLNSAAPEGGWARWAERQIEEAEFVIVVWTEAYVRRYFGVEARDVGLGAAWEAAIARQEIYESQGRTSKYISILFGDDSIELVPTIFRACTRFQLFGEYDALCEHLASPRNKMSRPHEKARIERRFGRSQGLRPLRALLATALTIVLAATAYTAWFKWYDLPSRVARARFPPEQIGVLVVDFWAEDGRASDEGAEHARHLERELRLVLDDPQNSHLGTIASVRRLAGPLAPWGLRMEEEVLDEVIAATAADVIVWGTTWVEDGVSEARAFTLDLSEYRYRVGPVRGLLSIHQVGEVPAAGRVVLDQKRLIHFVAGHVYLKDKSFRHYARAIHHLDIAYCSRTEAAVGKNLCHAGISIRNNAEVGLRLAEALVFSGRVAACNGILDEVQPQVGSGPSADTLQHARALNLRGLTFIQTKVSSVDDERATVAIGLFNRAIELAQPLSEPWFETKFRGNLGSFYLTVGHPAESRLHSGIALDLATENGYPKYTLMWRSNLARAAQLEGKNQYAVAEFVELVDAAKELGEEYLVAAYTYRLAELLLAEGELDRARNYATNSLAIAKRSTNTLSAARDYVLLAQIAVEGERVNDAKRHLEDAAASFQRVGLLPNARFFKVLEKLEGIAPF